MEDQKYIIERILKTKREEKFIKDLSFDYWMNRVRTARDEKNEQLAERFQLTAAAAKEEAKECQHWIEYLETCLQLKS